MSSSINFTKVVPLQHGIATNWDDMDLVPIMVGMDQNDSYVEDISSDSVESVDCDT